jgi:hypothetical protein
MMLSVIAEPQAAQIGAVARRDGDSAVVTTSGDKALVTITSPRGIGSVTLDRKSEKWPTVVVRLKLRGLESLKIESGSIVLNGSFSSHGDGGRRLYTMSSDGKTEIPVERSNSLWTDIRAFDDRGREISGLPPEGGWFEFDIPAPFLKDQRNISINWIDFYR